MWYEYSQNNSGGSDVYDDNRGLSGWVFIEADSAKEADKHAKSIGIYFDGIDSGRDCDCCGDRWYANDVPGWDDGVDFEELKSRVESIMEYRWRANDNAIYIHPKDGPFFGENSKSMLELNDGIVPLD